jgi:hypothetical protein
MAPGQEDGTDLMKYLIKIDRSTVRPNPNAGRNRYYEPAYIEIEVQIRTGLTKLSATLGSNIDKIQEKLPETVKLTSLKLSEDDAELNMMALDSYTLENFLKKSGFGHREYTLIVNNHFQEILSAIPEPKYLYEYEKTTIQCIHCNKRFSYELIDDKYIENDDDWDYMVLKNACPKCGKAECCEIEYEQI